MNLVVPNDRVAPRPNLDPRKRVAVDIVVLQNPPPPSEKVDAPLEPPEDFVVSESGVAFARDPDTSVCVGKDLVLDELTPSLCA